MSYPRQFVLKKKMLVACYSSLFTNSLSKHISYGNFSQIPPLTSLLVGALLQQWHLISPPWSGVTTQNVTSTSSTVRGRKLMMVLRPVHTSSVCTTLLYTRSLTTEFRIAHATPGPNLGQRDPHHARGWNGGGDKWSTPWREAMVISGWMR